MLQPTICRQFDVSSRGHKLPQLQHFRSQQSQQDGPGLSSFGPSRILTTLPQTLAPNPEHYRAHLWFCLPDQNWRKELKVLFPG